MTKKLLAPSLPAAPNLEAFIRQGERPPSQPTNKRYPITLKVPEAWREPLQIRLVKERKTLIELGEELIGAYLGLDKPQSS